MGTITLDDRDRAILESLDQGDADIDSLASVVSCRAEYLRERLPELADNGLVEAVGGDRYRVTANGERAIASSPAGTMDDRIDTPAAVERRIESFDCRPDREEAVRNAFAFLHYWGEATEIEIIDGVYSENPAGFDDSETWWEECVRDRLEALPGIEPPGSSGEPWRYTGTATIEEGTDDGRVAPDANAVTGSSVKSALEHAPLTDAERSAVRAAFERLFAERELTETEIRERVYPDESAGYESASAWWTECVGETFASLPGVERSKDGEDAWRYRHADEGAASSDPGAEMPDEQFDSERGGE